MKNGPVRNDEQRQPDPWWQPLVGGLIVIGEVIVLAVLAYALWLIVARIFSF